MIQSEEISELLAALVEVQSELQTIQKGETAQGNKFSYKYASLDAIAQEIKPILHSHGVAYMQSVGGLNTNALTLTTRIFNNKGQYIEDTAALPPVVGGSNAAQALGMSITYMRRYALSAMLGITSDEDIDGNGYKTTPTQENQQPQKTTEKQPPTTSSKKTSKTKQPAKFDFEPKGGETTPAKKREIGSLLASKYANGAPVFSIDEAKKYSAMRKNYTACEVIDAIKKELQARLHPTQTMQTAGDIMRAQQEQQAPQQLPPQVEAVKNAFDGEVVTPPQPSFDDMQPVEQSEQGFDIY